MAEYLTTQFTSFPVLLLLVVIVVCLAIIGKGADLLVTEAVTLSLRWGIPSVVVGATIVSLGTTLPEAAVSVMGAVSGNPELALGNAVGSIIADTGLILGLAAILAPLPLNKAVVNRQGWIQVGSGFLLVAACFPWSAPQRVFLSGVEGGGVLHQWMGWVFLVLLGVYLYVSIRWSRTASAEQKEGLEAAEEVHVDEKSNNLMVFLKFILGMALVVGSSQILIPAVEVTAEKVGVPEAIIAATLVALGTSLPELVTAITAVRKNHGELAVGNVIGADILNVLFVAGAAAAVTPEGLQAGRHFFVFLFPAMLFLLIVFRVGVYVNQTHLRRPFGILLLVIYLGVTLASYLIGVDMH